MSSHPFAETPEPPYVAVIFTSLRTPGDNGYAVMSASLDALAREQPGFLGIESAREGLGITVSYWADQAAAQSWKQVAAHLVAQRRGRDVWYADYRVRVATVEREYGRDSSPLDTER
ncbi:antibiotic biosynthesis monooxygenase family protein [Micromonospora avicenniae]|uniref:antibiotic biosynthesis monooxygenase family protein n=1 Tax=Micromonospora avicenniae TaxID=1198245 RepID=UPI003445C66F